MEGLEQHLKMHGSFPMSYSTLQNGMSHFLLKDIGFIGFAKSLDGKLNIALSDPVCDEANYKAITQKFLDYYDKAMFVQISEKYAEVLDKLGFFVNEMGVETNLSIENYSFSGNRKDFLRRHARQAKESGLIVEEAGDIKSLESQLKVLSDEWIETKPVNDKEIWFVARNAVYDNEPGVRKFVAKKGDDVEGFVFFDPMYKDGKVIGYYADLSRTKPGTHTGVLPLIMKEAIDVFKSEGIETVSLGISPFFNIEDGKYKHSQLMQDTFNFLFNYGNKIYPFKNLGFIKSRYGAGVENGKYRDDNVGMDKVYVAQASKYPVTEILDAFKMMGIIEGATDTVKRLDYRQIFNDVKQKISR